MMHEIKNTETASDRIPIRPHHGMCLAYYRGEGYSEGFTGHMGEMLARFEQGADVTLQCTVDEICSACPNNQNGLCDTEELVQKFDQKVLELCHLEDEQEIPFLDFTNLVQTEILSKNLRKDICGCCQWNSICEEETSRWEKRKYV